jgi:cyd operon protein YbgT
MWYFSWILGLSLACAFGILNAMWFELREGDAHRPDKPGEAVPGEGAGH